MSAAALGPPAFQLGDYVPSLAPLAVATALVLVLLRRAVLSKIRPPPATVRQPWWRKALAGAAWAAALLAASLAVPAALGSFAPAARGFHPFTYPQAPAGLPNVGRVAALFFVQTLWEELVFRGVAMGLPGLLLALLLGRSGVAWRRAWVVAGLAANVLQAGLFALVHRGNPAATPLSLLNIFLAGALLGALFWSQGSLWGAWALHFLWNLGLAASGLPVSGVTATPALLPLGIRGAREDLLSGGRFGPEGSLLATVLLATAAASVLRALRPHEDPADDSIGPGYPSGMVKGNRDYFTCAACGKRFTFWVLEANPHPKVKCYYCGTESFPKGEPPAAPAPAPAPPPSAPAPPPAPDGGSSAS